MSDVFPSKYSGEPTVALIAALGEIKQELYARRMVALEELAADSKLDHNSALGLAMSKQKRISLDMPDAAKVTLIIIRAKARNAREGIAKNNWPVVYPKVVDERYKALFEVTL